MGGGGRSGPKPDPEISNALLIPRFGDRKHIKMQETIGNIGVWLDFGCGKHRKGKKNIGLTGVWSGFVSQNGSSAPALGGTVTRLALPIRGGRGVRPRARSTNKQRVTYFFW